VTRTTVLSPQELAVARPAPPLDESQAGIAARVAERIRRGDLYRDVLDFLVPDGARR
jgi:hypothetical protein